MAIILPYKNVYPKIHKTAFIAENAVIIGDVVIEEDCGIWYNCVIRADVNYIRVGAGTNIQDGTVVHVNRNNGPTIIGKGVTVGHMALLHGCTLKDNCFVGMGAQVIDFATVETNAMVAAGALVTPKKVVKSGELWAGSPAKFFRDLSVEEIDYIGESRDNYIKLKNQFLTSM